MSDRPRSRSDIGVVMPASFKSEEEFLDSIKQIAQGAYQHHPADPMTSLRQSLETLLGPTTAPTSPLVRPVAKSPKEFLPALAVDEQKDFVKYSIRPSTVALDIGGSLAKIVVFESQEDPQHNEAIQNFINASIKYGESGSRQHRLCFDYAGGRFHFIHFETRHMEGFFNLILDNKLHVHHAKTVPATGGGAHKFAEIFEDRTGLELQRHDELDCLLRGINFVLRHVQNECYYFKDPMCQAEDLERVFIQGSGTGRDIPFPYLLVNIGTGVSIMRVDSEDKHERVSGSGLGGGTFFGLARLLTGIDSFDDILALSEAGDTRKVDMTVGDIYGGAYASMGLSKDLVASCFGKMVMKEEPRDGIEDSDLVVGLLQMLTNNLGQLAYLNAQRFGVRNVFFAGNFIRRNQIALHALSRAIHFWSQGSIRACFLFHEGYLGALGAFLETSHVEIGTQS